MMEFDTRDRLELKVERIGNGVQGCGFVIARGVNVGQWTMAPTAPINRSFMERAGAAL